MILRRCYVTLVELLIVLALLSLMAGFIGINITKALQQQRFKTEVSLIVDQLRLAQDLMLILGSDVHFKIIGNAKNTGITYGIYLENQLSKNWDKEIKRAHKKLKMIHSVEFEDALDLPVKMGEIDFKFLSGGSVMSKGILRFSTSENKNVKGALEAYVCLQGYPTAIVSVSEESQCAKSDEKGSEEELTRHTVEEIRGHESA